MSKYPQDRFPRLSIVGSTNKKLRPVGTQWWGPKRSRNLSLHNQPPQKLHAPSQSIRMAVMPTLSRNLWVTAIARICHLIRDYFVTGTAQQRGAVVLSFRRHAAQARKKSSGSVCWHSDQEVAPQEGGRG